MSNLYSQQHDSSDETDSDSVWDGKLFNFSFPLLSHVVPIPTLFNFPK